MALMAFICTLTNDRGFLHFIFAFTSGVDIFRKFKIQALFEPKFKKKYILKHLYLLTKIFIVHLCKTFKGEIGIIFCKSKHMFAPTSLVAYIANNMKPDQTAPFGAV